MRTDDIVKYLDSVMTNAMIETEQTTLFEEMYYQKHVLPILAAMSLVRFVLSSKIDNDIIRHQNEEMTDSDTQADELLMVLKKVLLKSNITPDVVSAIENLTDVLERNQQ